MNWRGWRGVFCTFCFLGQSRWEILKRNFRKSQAMIWPQVLLLKTNNGKGKPTGSVINIFGSSVQSFIYVWLFATPWTVARQASLSITSSWSLLKLMSIGPVMPCNHLILCHPLLLPSVFPGIRYFSKESVLCIRWPKDWSFSFSISYSNEYSGLISFTIDGFDLLAV